MGNFQKRRLRLMKNLKLRVTLKKLNIITDREKSIQDRLELIMMLFWHGTGRTIFCRSVTKHSQFLKIQSSKIQMLLTKTAMRGM